MIKHLRSMLAAAVLLTANSAFAQTDITETYMTNASLTTYNSNGWTCTYAPTNRWNFSSYSEGAQASAAWAAEDGEKYEMREYSLLQNITLPAGKYRLTVIACFRHGNNFESNTSYAYLKAGDNQTQIVNLHDNAISSATNLHYNKNREAYLNTVDFTLNAEQTISVGIEGTFPTDTDPTVYKSVLFIDNFKLYKMNEHTRTTAVGNLGTICLPYAATATGANLYTAAINGSSVTLTPHEGNLVAGTAYVYEATAATQTFSWAYDAEPVAAPTAGDLTGVFAPTKLTAGQYVMQTQSEVQKFFKVVADSEPTLAAYRAYLTMPAAGGKYAEYDIEHGQTTGINAVNAASADDAAIYNISGQKISRLQKGINIINGKKVIVK